MGRRSYSGTAVPTVLSGGIGALDLSFTVQDATGYPDGTAGPFYVTLARGVAGEEKILCDSRSGLTFTVNAAGRGADGTVATSHTASSTTVEHTITKTDLDEANAHVNQTAEADNPHPQYIKTSAANAAYHPRVASAARAISTVDQSVPNATVTILGFGGESYDTGNFHDNVTNVSRLTVPAGKAGVYAITGMVDYASNSTGGRQARIHVNGALRQVVAVGAAAASTRVAVSDVLVLAAGDYVELAAFQDSGAALNTGTLSNLALAYLGA